MYKMHKMIWDIYSKEEKNKILLKLLIYVCKADNIIQEGEFSYLIYMCKNLNLDPQLIKEYAEIQDINEYLPQLENERMEILYHLLFAMNADSNVAPEEEIIIYQLAFRLGFSEAITKDFILLMKKHSLQEIPTTEMVNIIRKYCN